MKPSIHKALHITRHIIAAPALIVGVIGLFIWHIITEKD